MVRIMYRYMYDDVGERLRCLKQIKKLGITSQEHKLCFKPPTLKSLMKANARQLGLDIGNEYGFNNQTRQTLAFLTLHRRPGSRLA